MVEDTNESNELFHYTTANGLMGILKSQTLWCTHARYLNDTNELAVGIVDIIKPTLLEGFTEKIKTHNNIQEDNIYISNMLEDYTWRILNSVSPIILKNVFLFSFCAHLQDTLEYENGLLSMWRGYGKDGGYSLVFNKEDLQHHLPTEFNPELHMYLSTFQKVSYTHGNDDKSSLIDETKEMIDKIRNNPLDVKEVARAIMYFATHYKDTAFREENEVRLAIILQEQESAFKSGIRIQLMPDTLRPYIEFPEQKNEKKNFLPIERIIVGPHSDKEARAEALQMWLSQQEDPLSRIEVTYSDIPYINR